MLDWTERRRDAQVEGKMHQAGRQEASREGTCSNLDCITSMGASTAE